jgi:hypothetical protein
VLSVANTRSKNKWDVIVLGAKVKNY